MKVRPTILLADDHSVTAEALRVLLSEKFEVLGLALDGRVLIAQANKFKPDLVVTDMRMPLLNGLDAAEQIRQSWPQTRFVFLTMIDNPNIAAAALRFAPVGFVLKHSAVSELMTAINEVLRGRSFVTPRLRPENWTVQQGRSRQFSRDLTPRQRDVLQLLAEGHQMKAIAEILELSEKTVQFHKYQIMKSWNIQNNAELVLFAAKNGLVHA